MLITINNKSETRLLFRRVFLFFFHKIKSIKKIKIATLKVTGIPVLWQIKKKTYPKKKIITKCDKNIKGRAYIE